MQARERTRSDVMGGIVPLVIMAAGLTFCGIDNQHLRRQRDVLLADYEHAAWKSFACSFHWSFSLGTQAKSLVGACP